MLSLLRPTAASSANIARRIACCRPPISAFHHQQRSESTLVIAEPSTDESTLAPSTLSAISAASKLHSGPISLLTFSSGDVGVPSSVSSVIQANADGNSSLLAETVTNAVVAANAKYGYSHIVAAGTKFGANYLGRAGAQLGVSPISDVVEVLSAGMSICGALQIRVCSQISPCEHTRVGWFVCVIYVEYFCTSPIQFFHGFFQTHLFVLCTLEMHWQKSSPKTPPSN